MSVQGRQSRHFGSELATSGLHLAPDMSLHGINRRYVPRGDIRLSRCVPSLASRDGSPHFKGRGWSPSIALTTTLRALPASSACCAIRSLHSATIWSASCMILSCL